MKWLRLIRNLWLDLRYGGQWLGGSERTRFADKGAYDVSNSDYGILDQVPWNVRPGEVLVDLGCGRGRVLNWWLSRFPGHRLIGVELDPDVAARTRARLARFRDVEVITGSAPEVLAGLKRADVVYMHNPFNAEVMAKVETQARRKQCRVFYHNPLHLDCWRGWSIARLVLAAPWGETLVAAISPSGATANAN